MALPKLGIVAGKGRLPHHLIDSCRAAGRECFVLALVGHADREQISDASQEWIRLGEVGTGIELLHREGVEDLVFAGAVRRPSLAELRPDWRSTKILARLGRNWIGDNSLLSALVREMEEEGFNVVAPDSLLQEFVAAEGAFGALTPDQEAADDIERGIDVAKTIGSLDVGQAVIVQHRIVLGVEGAEGTDALIERCAPLHRKGPGGVLIKFSKRGQERRIDLPAIGPATIAAAAGAGLRGIAVEAGGALVFEPERVGREADAAGLFVVAVPVPA